MTQRTRTTSVYDVLTAHRHKEHHMRTATLVQATATTIEGTK